MEITLRDYPTGSGITPREYQIEALEAILARREEGVTRQLCVLPTGTGKTILFGLLARELNVRTLIVAPRQQLVLQAVEKIHLIWPEANIGVCMADKDEIDAQVVVASVQTASRPNRLERLKEKGFRLAICDEAHHCPSASYVSLLVKGVRPDIRTFSFPILNRVHAKTSECQA